MISTSMLTLVKMSGRVAREATSKEKEKKEKEAATKTSEREANRKRKVAEDAKKEWDCKKKEFESSLVQFRSKLTTSIEDILSKVGRSTEDQMKDWMTAMRLANKDKKVRSNTERKIQEELRNHMGKRKKPSLKRKASDH